MLECCASLSNSMFVVRDCRLAGLALWIKMSGGSVEVKAKSHKLAVQTQTGLPPTHTVASCTCCSLKQKTHLQKHIHSSASCPTLHYRSTSHPNRLISLLAHFVSTWHLNVLTLLPSLETHTSLPLRSLHSKASLHWDRSQTSLTQSRCIENKFQTFRCFHANEEIRQYEIW